MKWYVLTTRYLKAFRVAAEMDKEGLECFVPPKITNMLFVHSTRERIQTFLTYNAIGQKLGFMRSSIDLQPIIVPDRDMQYFMLICAKCDMPIIMQECPRVKLGDRVRVVSGPLAGVEGNVVRIRKSKRVLVAIGQLVWVATTYIPMEMLEVIDVQ